MTQITPEPWKCPACGTWIRGDVPEHRCDPDGGVTADLPQPPAGSPPAAATAGVPHWLWATTAGTGTLSWTFPPGTVANIGYPSGSDLEAHVVDQISRGLASVDEAQAELRRNPWELRGGRDPRL